jgi:hypothetical protein
MFHAVLWQRVFNKTLSVELKLLMDLQSIFTFQKARSQQKFVGLSNSMQPSHNNQLINLLFVFYQYSPSQERDHPLQLL